MQNGYPTEVHHDTATLCQKDPLHHLQNGLRGTMQNGYPTEVHHDTATLCKKNPLHHMQNGLRKSAGSHQVPTVQNDYRTTMLQSAGNHLFFGQGRIPFPSSRNALHHGTFHRNLQGV